MEVFGGNAATNRRVETTGLDVAIFSQPHESDPVGGDVHYLTSCASGRITRLLLADVAGHGESVSARAKELRDLARENVNHMRHTRMVTRTNAAFTDDASLGAFATAVFLTYFQPTKALRLCNAGHPPPLHFSAESRRWTPLGNSEQRNLPLGVLAESNFHEESVRLEPNDAVLVVTDGILESRDGAGEMLEPEGLVRWLDEIGPPTMDLPLEIARRIEERSSGDVGDDITMLLLQPNDNRVGLKDHLLSPVRFVKDLVSGGRD